MLELDRFGAVRRVVSIFMGLLKVCPIKSEFFYLFTWVSRILSVKNDLILILFILSRS